VVDGKHLQLAQRLQLFLIMYAQKHRGLNILYSRSMISCSYKNRNSKKSSELICTRHRK